MELTGKDGGPIQTQEPPPDLSMLTDDELELLEHLTRLHDPGTTDAQRDDLRAAWEKRP